MRQSGRLVLAGFISVLVLGIVPAQIGSAGMVNGATPRAVHCCAG